MKIDGKEYDEKEIDFTNVLCDLEDVGIDVMNMSGQNLKTMSLCRGIVSVYTGEKNIRKCGTILSNHLLHGGKLDDLLEPFMEAMKKSGFGVLAGMNTEETPE